MRKKSDKPKKVKIPVSTGKERKAFAVKMLVDNPKPVWMGELKAVKDIYAVYPIDFLNKVAKPNFKINSCFYFLSEDGKKYLEGKLKEFLYKPKRYDIVEGDEKVGEDWTGKPKIKFRDFLK